MTNVILRNLGSVLSVVVLATALSLGTFAIVAHANGDEGFDPYAGGFDPYEGGFDPYEGGFDPYAGGFDPYEGGFDPYAG
ncbi:hypothetical protein HY414_00870, partial [Candidatus Kaiserbacteria bacterium]|nr:hypothetical protein [Candidatus Kaiserbacteria bacterium]